MGFSKQKENAIKKVRENSWGLSELKQFKTDRDVAIEALKAHGSKVFNQIDDSLKNNKEILLLGLENYRNLESQELAKDEDIQKAYVKSLEKEFNENLILALRSLKQNRGNFVKLEEDIVKKYWNSKISLENLYNWFIEKGLEDRLPNPNDFKVNQLHENLKKVKENIQNQKNYLESYFRKNEYDFGRSQWSVKNHFENIVNAYEKYIFLKESFQEDLEQIKQEDFDLEFLLDLKDIDLSKSKIDSLPEDFKLLHSIKNVNVSNTKIREINLKFDSYTKPYFDISGTEIEISEELLKKVNVSNFDIDTKIDSSLLSRFSGITNNFVRDEKDPIKKIKLAQKYNLNTLRINPQDLTEKFFELDFSGIKLIDLYSNFKPVDDLIAEKLNKISPETVYSYKTTVGKLKERFKNDFDEEEQKEIAENYDEVFWEDVKDSEELFIVSYLDFSDGILEIECSKEKASIIANFEVDSDKEKMVLLNSEDGWLVTLSLLYETTVYAGTFEWSYEYTDTNDGALDLFRANCSAELDDISLLDAIRFQIGDMSGEDIVDEYNINYDREDEGVYY
jgi:hypothetical protein